MLAETIIKIAMNEVLENLTLGYKVAPENVEIDWNLQEPFIRTYDQPVIKRQASLGPDGANLHVGIFHIEICHPSKIGIIKPLEIAELILPNYERGKNLIYDGNKILCERAEIKTAYTENSWYILPIHVRYSAYMEN